jgi:hypothetical protein
VSTVESKEGFSGIPRIPRIVPVAVASDRGGRGMGGGGWLEKGERGSGVKKNSLLKRREKCEKCMHVDFFYVKIYTTAPCFSFQLC